MAIERAYRHELKYFINLPEYALLRQRLAAVMRRDPHVGPSGEYMVRSLYFDDYWNTAYQDKENGTFVRKKYRIRIYDHRDTQIFLERKAKVGDYIHKDSAPLSRADVEAIVAGDYGVLRRRRESLLLEFYFECTANLMRPRVIVDYDREPFVMDAGEVRLTFDKHVRAGMGRLALFDADLPTAEVMPADRLILEVKYTSFLPKMLRRMLTVRSADLTAASKFMMCCDAAARDKTIQYAEGLQWQRGL